MQLNSFVSAVAPIWTGRHGHRWSLGLYCVLANTRALWPAQLELDCVWFLWFEVHIWMCGAPLEYKNKHLNLQIVFSIYGSIVWSIKRQKTVENACECLELKVINFFVRPTVENPKLLNKL